MLVSVIIVSYNSGALLLRCVRSALASSVPVEVLVSDNGSTDGSLDVLTGELGAHAALRVLRNGRNLGFAAGCNVAIRQARGDYLLLLNPDALIESDTLAQAMAALKADAGAGMAGCLILNADGTEQAGCRRRVPLPGRAFAKAFRAGRWLPGAGRDGSIDMKGEPLPGGPVEVEAISGAFMLVERSALDAVGLLDEGYFLHCEDLDWCMRFREAGYRILFVPSVRIMHVKGTSSAGRPIRVEWHKHRGMLRFYRKFFLRHYSWPTALAVAGGVWLHFALTAARLVLRRIGSQ